MKTISKLLSFVFFTSITAQAQPEYNVSEKDFRLITSELVRIYRPIFEKKGVDFWIERDWSARDCSLYSKKFADPSWKIYVSGCFARQPEITKEGLIMALCHQMGHLMAGKFETYASEVEAKRYTDNICAELVFKEWSKRFNLKMYNMTIDDCEKIPKDKDVCYYKYFGKKSIESIDRGFCNGPQSNSYEGH
jgi:hypothetical protein